MENASHHPQVSTPPSPAAPPQSPTMNFDRAFFLAKREAKPVGKLTLKKWANEPNPAKHVDNSKKGELGHINSLANEGLLDHATYPTKFLALTQDLVDGKVEGKLMKPNARNAYVNTLSGTFYQFTDDERDKCVKQQLLKCWPEHFKPEDILAVFPREKRIQMFNDCIHQRYKDYNSKKCKDEIRGKTNEAQVASKRHKERYVPYPTIVTCLLAAEEKWRPMTKARMKCDFGMIVFGLMVEVGPAALRLDYADLCIDDPEASARFDPVTYTALWTYLNKIDNPNPGPYTITFGDATPEERRLRKYLFLTEGLDYAGNQAKQCSWAGGKLPATLKKAGLGEKLTIGSLRLSLAVHLHRQHDGTLISQNRICERLNHNWTTQQSHYNIMQGREDENVEEVEVPEEEMLVVDVEAEGGEDAASTGSRPETLASE
ncbi:hypothetical protein HK097_008407 [Rhizophlyctis rosea]|uniref:Uncharacterized protein n=1 Tax=Rhizophlyctis rosea TaxID=64517 RepID=A0AAD5X5A8_9FUNG|nr:hypothetical protein HK097_008407 [Rhizophlyctis rosea]